MLLYSVLYVLTLLSITHGLNCIVCSSATDVNCVDPYHTDTAVMNSYSRPDFVSCLKTDYWAGYGTYSYSVVIRSGQHQACTFGSTTGTVARAYCCSDKDNCNTAAIQSVRTIETILLLFANQAFLSM